LEEELDEDLICGGIGEELNRGDATENERFGEDERGEKKRNGGGGGVLEVALREVVNPRMKGGDGDGVAGTGSPDFGVDREELRRRGVMRLRLRVRLRARARVTLRIGRHFGI
jgi:hypothetical protein